MIRIPVYILAGGCSSRFGSDKARALLDGRPLLRRLADAIEPVAEYITVVAEVADKYSDLRLHTIADLHGGHGPLGGLHAALADSTEAGWLLLLSCDIVTLRLSWVYTLIQSACDSVQAAAYKPDRRWQPLLALYHASIQPAVEQRLARRQLAMRDLLNDSAVAVPSLPSDWPNRLQINTRDEWKAVQRFSSKTPLS